jgi:hypothetical protein
MPVSPADLTAAQQQEAAAYTAWQQAEADLNTIMSDPNAGVDTPPVKAAQNKAQSARLVYQAARTTNTNLKNQANKENPPPKTPPAQTQSQMTDEQQKDWNNKHFGLNLTNAQLQERMQQQQPRPPTTPNAVQVQNSQTSQVNATETGRHNLVEEQDAQIKNQITAQKNAVDAANNRRNQIGSEAVSAAQIQNQGIGEVRGAATTLITAEDNQNARDLEQAKARNAFFDNVNQGVMSGVLKLITMGKNGSKAAIAFATAYMAMANTAYKQSGLDKDVKHLDPNSPAMKALTQIAGYQLPEQIGTVPPTRELDARTAVSSARAGFPPPGWNGPIGVDAFAVADDLGIDMRKPGQKIQPDGTVTTTPPASTDGAPPRDLNQLRGDAEAEAINQEYKASIAGLVTKPKEQWTPEEHNQYNILTQNASKKLQDLYDKKFRSNNVFSSSPQGSELSNSVGRPYDASNPIPPPPNQVDAAPVPYTDPNADMAQQTPPQNPNADIPDFGTQPDNTTFTSNPTQAPTQVTSFQPTPDPNPEYNESWNVQAMPDYGVQQPDYLQPQDENDEEAWKKMPNFGYSLL